MAPKRKKPLPLKEPSGKEYGTSRMLDKASFLAGAVGGALVIALIVLAYVASQQVQEQIVAVQKPSLSPKQPEPEKFPGGMQFTVKNNENKSIAITSGNSPANLTATLKPGEAINATVMPPKGCGADIGQCRGAITLTYVVLYSPAGNDTGQGGAGMNGTGNGGSGTGNGTLGGGGNGGGAGGPLAITTSQLASAVQDAKYSFALEAEGGTGNYYWSATGFPIGLSMSNRGLISGAALQKGTFSIQVVLADGSSTVVSDMALQVN